jgi:hypothetical protein
MHMVFNDKGPATAKWNDITIALRTAMGHWRLEAFWRKKRYLEQIVRLHRSGLSKTVFNIQQLPISFNESSICRVRKKSISERINLAPDDEIGWHRRQPDSCLPFFVKRLSWSWFSAELVRIQPTELEYRVEGKAGYLALHDFVRADGETSINGATRSTLSDVRGKLTFLPTGSFAEGWTRFKSRVSSVFADHLAPVAANQGSNDISSIAPCLYFENDRLRATLLKLQGALDGSGIAHFDSLLHFASVGAVCRKTAALRLSVSYLGCRKSGQFCAVRKFLPGQEAS